MKNKLEWLELAIFEGRFNYNSMTMKFEMVDRWGEVQSFSNLKEAIHFGICEEMEGR